MIETILSIAFIVVLLMLSALFSSTETSLFALDHMKLRKMRRSKSIRRIKQLLAQASLTLIAILFANTAVNVASSSLLEGVLKIENTILSTVIVTSILLMFGEITPKTIAISQVEKTATFTSRVFFPIFTILKPLVYPLEKLSEAILKRLNRLFPPREEEEEDHLAALLSIVSRGSFLENEEKTLVESVLKFSSKEVWNIMTPRTKVISVEENEPIQTIVHIVKTTKFSKIPVYSKTDDNMVGVVHLRKVFPFLYNPEKTGNRKAKDIMESLYFVPQTKKLSEMLDDFQKKKNRVAAVVDEYGSGIGIVTITDVLGEIVGDFVDDSFAIRNKIVRITKNRYLVSGDIGLDEFNQFFDINLKSEEYESLAGYVIEKAEDLPDVGYSIDVEKYIVTVRDRKTNQIDKFLVERK